MLPPIIFGKRKKNENLFPKLGGMGSSAYTNSSPYSSIYKNRIALEGTTRDKIRTGEEVNYKQLQLQSSARSLEDSESENKQLVNYSKHRRGMTIKANSNSTALVTSPVKSKKIDIRKHSIENRSVMIVENQLVPTQADLKQRLSLRLSHKKVPDNKLKSINRYKNTSSVEEKAPKEFRANHNTSMIRPKVDHLDIDDKTIKRYEDVKTSVEEHLKKYEWMIPDVRKKKTDLLKQILGEKSFNDIRFKLERKRLVGEKNNDNKTFIHKANIDLKSNLKNNLRENESPSKSKTKSNDEGLKYKPHKGKIAESYQRLGGLGPNQDEKWTDVQNRRKQMLYFADTVNQK
jgi:hypothetical protein